MSVNQKGLKAVDFMSCNLAVIPLYLLQILRDFYELNLLPLVIALLLLLTSAFPSSFNLQTL